jgi:hypothetical protein
MRRLSTRAPIRGTTAGRRRALAALAVGLALLLGPVPAAAQPPRAERPTYAVGTRWLLAGGVYELARIEDGLYVFVAGPGRRIHLTRDLAPVYVVEAGVVEWDLYPAPEPRWPLQVGRWGVRSSVLRTRHHPSGVSVRVTWQVEAYEAVRVPAGAFDAFRIVYAVDHETTGRLTRAPILAGPQSWRVAVWYAPAARQIVKAEAVGAEALALEVVALDAGAPPGGSASVAGAPVAPAPPRPDIEAPAALPRISVAAPADRSRVDSAAIGVAAVVEAAAGVSRVVVLLNGVEVGRIEPASPEPTLAVNLPVTLRAGDNTLVLAAGDARGGVAQEVRTVRYERQEPLAIEVRHPADQARVTAIETTVAALVTSSRGVAEVAVLVNGAPAFERRERAPQASVAVVAPVRLRAGDNVIVVSAREAGGAQRQAVRTVTYVPPADAPGPAPDRTRERWAVVIGIGRYDRPGIPPLGYAVADAQAFYDLLVQQAGFKPDHVLLLTDNAERRPTLRNLKWALGTFLARSAARDDLVLVYYAGHGAPEVDPRGVEPDGLAKYLVPIDADPDDLYATALPMDEFQIIFNRIEAERVVVFVDACYSGAAGGRTFAAQRTRAARLDDVFLDRLTRAKGRVIVTAARASEVSLELPELGHGIFTHYLVQGLRGAADLDLDGIVALQELYQYLEQQVSRKSRAAGGNQHPVMKGELEGTLPLVRAGRR